MGSSTRLCLVALRLGVWALPFQVWPRLPVPLVQLSDVAFLCAAGLGLPALWAAAARRGPAFWLTLAYLGGALLSAVASGGSMLKLVGHAELGVIFLLTEQLVREDPAQGPRLVRTLWMATLLAAGLGLVGAVLFYLGVPSLLLNPHPGDLLPGNYPRVRGLMVRSNMLASFLAVGLLLSLEKARRRRDRKEAAMAYGATLGVGLAMLLTFSRSLMSCGLMAGWLVLVHRRPARRVVFWLLGAALAAALLASALFVIDLNPADPFSMRVHTDAPGTRSRFWMHAWSNIVAHPLVGIGPGHPPAGVFAAHNTWLDIWAQLGLVPFLAFAGLLVVVLHAVRRADTRAQQRAQSADPRAAVWIAILGAFILDTLTLDIEDFRHVWLTLALAMAHATATRPKSRAE